VLFVTLGPLAHEAVAAADLLAEDGIEATVAVVSSFNPAPEADLFEALARAPLALTVEGHYVNGGVGSLVAELVAEGGLDCRVVRHGVREMPHGRSGSQAFLHEAAGLTPRTLARTAVQAFQLAR
jgi:transketolase